MKCDPLTLNFCEKTGGYTWQIAEYLSRDSNEPFDRIELKVASPPRVASSLPSFPYEVDPSFLVKWSPDVEIVQNAVSLLGRRGSLTNTVIAISNGAFAEFDDDFVQSLRNGVFARSMSQIALSGKPFAARNLLVTLMRHGFVEFDRELPMREPVAFVREQTCCIRKLENDGCIAMNQLNGRALQLGAVEKALLEGADIKTEMPDKLRHISSKLSEAGMLRFLS